LRTSREIGRKEEKEGREEGKGGKTELYPLSSSTLSFLKKNLSAPALPPLLT
jgi:hypothetical protein